MEHEVDHVLVGIATDEPVPNPDEVDDWAWKDFIEVREQALAGNPSYAPWLIAALEALPDLDASLPESAD